MADWVDSYHSSKLIGSGELDRLFREFDAGRISRNYMLGLLGMSSEDLDEMNDDLKRLRARYGAENADG